MQQKKKTKSQVKLNQLSEELSALAKDLANGQLRIGSSLIHVGEPFFLKTKQKVKDNKAYFTLSFQVPLTENIEEKPTPFQEKPKTSPNEKKTPSTKPVPRKEGAPGGKKLKKEIGRLWKSIAKNIGTGQTPSQTDTKSLIKKCEDYNMYAEHPWQDDWNACFKAVEQCAKAATNGDFDTAKTLVAEVNRLTKVCHKKYK